MTKLYICLSIILICCGCNNDELSINEDIVDICSVLNVENSNVINNFVSRKIQKLKFISNSNQKIVITTITLNKSYENFEYYFDSNAPTIVFFDSLHSKIYITTYNHNVFIFDENSNELCTYYCYVKIHFPKSTIFINLFPQWKNSKINLSDFIEVKKFTGQNLEILKIPIPKE